MDLLERKCNACLERRPFEALVEQKTEICDRIST